MKMDREDVETRKILSSQYYQDMTTLCAEIRLSDMFNCSVIALGPAQLSKTHHSRHLKLGSPKISSVYCVVRRQLRQKERARARPG